ncbi:pirin family protein [Gordonia sp. HY002]|uniref:pirin family protein n=1 Tax=Gordonia zhenghanii TaxID=2911516 RepID=UPI001EEFE2AF|nr:pirin family protein [Gordonia zhenghanii]MCF8572058.1 pirin family protein [Gordonia zhenghanii]MCF8602932.1 pirin family protein [Gordonia zhenghanii]
MMITVIESADRHFWANEWLTSRQSFPGTGNFDLFDNAHGVLVMHNDDVVDAGEGLDAHRHQNMEILTWVLDGAVTHRDSAGNTGTLPAGTLGVMSAGTGITHAETNAATRAERSPLRVVQMWVAPHTDGLPPQQSEHRFDDTLASGQPVIVASGRPEHEGSDVARIANRFAALHIARPLPGATIDLPGAPFGHLYVARGAVTVDADGEQHGLGEGDAVRLTDSGAVQVTAAIDADRPEILYWEMHASFDLVRS